MKNNEMWIIKSGKIFMPFTARSTRRECIRDSLSQVDLDPTEWKNRDPSLSVVKIRVEEVR